MVERGPGDAQNFGDRRFRDRFGQEGLNLCLAACELRRPEDAFGPARQPPLGSGRCQAFFGALGDQIPLDFCKQTQQSDHDLGLHVLGAVELYVLLDGDEPHPLFNQAVYQLDDLLRLAGSLKRGWVTASLFIGKLQAYPL
jgi:hypothetical protein